MAGKNLVTPLTEGLDTPMDKKLCGNCSFSNKKVVAISWCKNCLEALCESCTAYHKGFRQSKHEMVPIDKMAKVTSLDFQEDEPCVKHTGKILEVYCVDHKEMCCVICLATSHRKCEHISTFEEMVSGSKDSESVEQFTDALCEIEKKTDALRIKANDNLVLMNSRHDEISKQVTTTVQQAKDKLDNLKSSFQKKFKQMHINELEKLAERKQKIEEFLKIVQKGQKSLNGVREHGSPKQIFITKEKLKVQLKQQIEGLKEDLAGAHCVEYVLNTECTVTSILNALISVAEVAVNSTFDLSTGVSEVSGIVDFFNNNGKQHKQIDIMEIEINKENSINPGGVIIGGTHLPDGRFVICFLVHGNSKLGIYDTAGVCLFEKLCSDNNPKDACLIPPSGRCILVSVYDKNILQKYDIEQNTMKEIGTITCKPYPWGLAASKENIIVGYGSEIDVMSMTGMVIRSISRRGDHLSYVAVSLSGNVYYTDNNNIVCATSGGNEVRRFTYPDVKSLTGIVADRYENVYACSYDSNNVAVLSSSGQTSKMLATGIGGPFKPCLDSTETKIIITTSRGVHCYRLKNRV